MKIGDKIPEFSVKDSKGNIVSDKSLRGQNVVIFFYPKDNSPVCTTEACSFRDNYAEFAKYNCRVIGISADSEESHNKFAQKHNLNYSLISDKGNELKKKFGVKDNLLGFFPGRETYLIDSDGNIRLVFNSQLNANSHVEKTLDFLKKYIQKD